LTQETQPNQSDLVSGVKLGIAKEFDVILYGASGFTGRQCVDYFRRHAPPGLRWAIAGRNLEKLKAIGAGVPVLVADSANQAQIDSLVDRTRVVVTTAGPFILYANLLLEACVRLGAHYIDIGGEPTWIKLVIERHQRQAEERNLKIVPGCGVCSVPVDLGVFLLEEKLGNRLAEARSYVKISGGSLNGGTMANESLSYASGDIKKTRDPFLLGPRLSRPLWAIERDPQGVGYDRQIRAWTAPCPMGISDTRTVRRSAALRCRDFAFQEYLAFEGASGLLQALGIAAAVAGLHAALSFVPARNLLQRMVPPGSGPNDRDMDAGSYECRIVGRTAQGMQAEVSLRAAGDPGNRVTVKCVCESALALAIGETDLPQRFGVLTPSVAFGHALIARLVAAGFEIR
jgi:short subunit dehydrogenase-like uncharacterized protein